MYCSNERYTCPWDTLSWWRSTGPITMSGAEGERIRAMGTEAPLAVSRTTASHELHAIAEEFISENRGMTAGPLMKIMLTSSRLDKGLKKELANSGGASSTKWLNNKTSHYSESKGWKPRQERSEEYHKRHRERARERRTEKKKLKSK